MNATSILIVFPHQLFGAHPGLEQSPDLILMLEDSLFFGDPHYPMLFHKQKLWLHRATMKRYETMLGGKGFTVRYLGFDSCSQGLERALQSQFAGLNSAKELIVVDPTDFILEKRIRRFINQSDLELTWLENPGFINTRSQNIEYRAGTKRWFMADFYKRQRTRLNVLMEEGKPVGGKWSFDADNRKKIPKKILNAIPDIPKTIADDIDREAVEYVNQNFNSNPGDLDSLFYPTSHQAAELWLKEFLANRFQDFGSYEDAIEEGQSWLWHSILTPMLNIGLLTPNQILRATTEYLEQHEVPINSSEGFIRQVIGWREFMRATYEDLGVAMRTTNHWQHHRKIPACFWEASTGIDPIDDTISRILKTGYCHHIERLMVMGGFMFLCEFDPDDIYRWFMEMFVDSYDWVMVPNAYAMSQNADGGLITTKPYFSGSSYIRKMSHYNTGKWCEIWDGLYWRWIWNHADELAKNPRWSMMCSMARKMDQAKRDQHLTNAEEYLSTLD